MRVLNNECLPIKYGEGFYRHILYGERYAKLAYFKDVLIGAMSWKIDRASEHTEEKETERLKKVAEEEERKAKGLEPEEQKEEEKKEPESKASKRKNKAKKRGGGGAGAKEKTEEDEADEKMVYMMTITILNSYRKMGFGKEILKMGEELWKSEGYKKIVLDVQTSNKEAIEFYKKHGFIQVREKPKYYTDLDPPDSFFFVKELA